MTLMIGTLRNIKSSLSYYLWFLSSFGLFFCCNDKLRNGIKIYVEIVSQEEKDYILHRILIFVRKCNAKKRLFHIQNVNCVVLYCVFVLVLVDSSSSKIIVKLPFYFMGRYCFLCTS